MTHATGELSRVPRRLAALLALVLLAALAPLAGTARAEVEVTQFPGRVGTIIEHSGDGLVPTFRYAGENRFDTASLIAQDDRTLQDETRTVFAQSDTVIVARADLFPDALAGNFLAGIERAPILLVSSAGPIDAATREALTEIDPDRVILLGSTAAISAQVATDLARDFRVERIGGAERTATAALIAETGEARLPDNETRTAIVASAVNFPDALVAGAVAYDAQVPLLLTNPETLSAVTAEALDDLDIDEVIIPGGTVAVSAAAQAGIERLGIRVVRAAGTTRVETAVQIANLATSRYGFTTSHVNFARGDQFPDALTMGPHAGEERAPLLLTSSPTDFDTSEGTNARYLDALGCDLRSIHLAGGQAAISLSAEEAIRRAATQDGPCVATLTPESATNLVGETHTVTVRVTNNAGAPETATVRFRVETATAAETRTAVETGTARVNVESATATTSETGTATFSFRGLTAGTVAITATFRNADGETATARALKTFSTRGFADRVTVAGIREHQLAWQRIADGNEGNRASGSRGYDQSAQYVFDRLTAAGYRPTFQEFTFPAFEELTPSEFQRTSPNPTTYDSISATAPGSAAAGDFAIATYSGSGDVTARATPVDIQLGVGNVSDSGCSTDSESADPDDPDPEDDFVGFPAGNIALVQRGFCTFAEKAANAEAAGASAVVIFNQGNANNPGRLDPFFGTLGADTEVTIPVIITGYALGVEFADQSDNPGGVTLRVFTDTLAEERTTRNVLAETPGGDPNNVVMVGAHLDSVAAGPGINDNGSGSGAILEVAEELAASGVQPVNKVRFAWWGAEESGLIGSTYYVDTVLIDETASVAADDLVLTPAGRAVRLYLNFDMVGSPNFVRFVYDGDQSTFPAPAGTPVPAGSAQIDRLFTGYFASRGLASEGTEFNGRSDYQAFIQSGIPAGGLFTGAEGGKTAEQARIYGGTAGQNYDPCYHQACDTYENVSLVALDQMSDAIAHAVLTYAASTASLTAPVTGQSGGGAGGGAASGGLHADHAESQ